jgi:hypothetical protein
MKTTLTLPANLWAEVLNHLLPRNAVVEEAAFMFAKTERTAAELKFEVVEVIKLTPQDFVARYADFIELKDEARARVIKRAHDLGASIVELHSHVGPWRAAFSFSDIAGLKDIVPHLWWRLKGKPYAALVVAKNGFDALVWADDPDLPRALDAVVAGDQVLQPTNETLKEWE